LEETRKRQEEACRAQEAQLLEFISGNQHREERLRTAIASLAAKKDRAVRALKALALAEGRALPCEARLERELRGWEGVIAGLEAELTVSYL